MDQTAAPAPTGLSLIGTVTTMHFVLMALLALLVIAAIIYGVRERGKRRAAEREEQARVASLADAEPPPAPERVEAARPAALARLVPEDRPPPVDTAPPSPRHDPLPRREPPAVVAAPAAPVPAVADAQLTQIKGLGPKVRARLAELGLTRVDQLAALSDDDAEALDAQLGAFRGRIARDRWVEQARFLAAGDVKGFEAVFGRL